MGYCLRLSSREGPVLSVHQRAWVQLIAASDLAWQIMAFVFPVHSVNQMVRLFKNIADLAP